MSRQDLKFIIDNITNNVVAEFIPSPKVRNACVAAIIRWRPYILDNINVALPLASTPLEFLSQYWVNDCHGQAEILFIQRALREGDFWSGHVAFPGGKNELQDKSNLDTVMRECEEEIGLNLDGPEFISLGTLKHRSITRSDSNTLMMTLVPHIFLQVTPITPELTIQPKEVADTHWISIRYLLENTVIPYNPKVRKMVKQGSRLPWPSTVRVPAIPLHVNNEPHLWGMTLRMTQEILGLELSPHSIDTSKL